MKAPATPTSARLIDDLRALPRPFWILFAGTFINRFGTFVWPFLTIYLTRQGHSLAAAATAVAATGAGSFIGSALGGWLSDHIGRRQTIVVGSAAAAAAMMLLYAAGSLPAIIASTTFLGIASATYGPAAGALLADVVPEHLRVRGYSALRLAGNAGFACGAGIGGIIANYSFLWLFVGDALTTLTYTAIALFALPQGLRGQTRQAPWSAAWQQIRGDRAFHALFIASCCSAFVFMQFGTTYSLHITRAGLELDLLGWKLRPEAIYGLLIGWNGVMVTLCELPLTSWTQRFDTRRTIALGYLLLGCGFALNGFFHTLPTLFAAMTAFTLGEIISIPVSSAYVSRLAPESMRGRYMGALAIAWNISGVAGPLIGAQLFQSAPALLWIACALLGVISSAVILTLGKTPDAVPDPAVAAEPALVE